MATASFSFGDVVLVPFPFTDQTGAKKRSAVVVSSSSYNTGRRDIVIMAITSQVREPQGFGETMAARFAGVGLSGALPQLQGHATEPMDFGNVRSDLQPSLTAAALRRLRREVQLHPAGGPGGDSGSEEV